MQGRAISFDGGIIGTDTTASPNTLVQRDSSGNIAVKNVGATSLSNTGQTVETPGTSITTSATIPAGVTFQPLDATAGVLTATLQPVGTSAGVKLVVIKVDSSGNLPTLKGSGSDPIIHKGSSANTYTGLTGQGYMGFLYCDGVSWYIGVGN